MALILERGDTFYGRGLNLTIISIVFTITAVGFVGARLASRMTTGRKFGLDDHAIILSVIFSIGLGICDCISVHHGYGKVSTTLSPANLHIVLQAFWASQIIYKFTINLTKTSICFLYLRIFPNLSFRRTVYIVMAYVILYAIASIIATIFQCSPILRVWDHTVPGTCINLTAFWYANATANIIGDFMILLLPMSVVRGLHLPRRQRYGLMFVFALGGFVCITSILRMTTLNSGSKSVDQTYGTLNSTIWTTIEANTGIICACLPMLKGPLTSLFPWLFPRGSSATPEYSGFSNSHRFQPASSDARTSPPNGLEGWDRLEDKKPVGSFRTSPGSKVLSKSSSVQSSDDRTEYGMIATDLQMGHITKKIEFEVQSARANTVPAPSPQAGGHCRSVSQAHLVGQDYVFP